MEFLGDSVLNLCVAHALYEKYSGWPEGRLTDIKSQVVSTQGLARAVETLRLREYARFGKGLRRENLPPSVYANLFEAITGAVFLDGGIKAAKDFVLHILGPEMVAAAESSVEQNPKSMLQHITQRNSGATPSYTLISETGPDHAKIFVISAVIRGRTFPPGQGHSKKEAEQAAARCALEVLQAESVLSESPPEGLTQAIQMPLSPGSQGEIAVTVISLAAGAADLAREHRAGDLIVRWFAVLSGPTIDKLMPINVMQKLIARLALAILALATALVSGAPAAEPQHEKPVPPQKMVEWEMLPPIPDALGVGGAYAGIVRTKSDTFLIVAGGANFPDKMPWDGGIKKYHDTVYALKLTANRMSAAGCPQANFRARSVTARPYLSANHLC